VIESTGLADPFPVLTTLHADPVLKHHFRASLVVTTVDAVNGAKTLAEHPQSVKQVAVADRILLTKTDLASSAVAAAVERRLRAINPAAPLLHVSDAPMLAGALLAGDATQRDPVSQEWFAGEMRMPDAGRHTDGIHAFAIVLDRPIDWTAFGIWLTMLLHRHGNAVLRVKGILNVSGTDAPVAVHGVQHLVHPPTHMRAWPDDDRRSRIVFIVKDLERGAIERSLAMFCGLDLGMSNAAA
jgi:G3E family GTPase